MSSVENYAYLKYRGFVSAFRPVGFGRITYFYPPSYLTDFLWTRRVGVLFPLNVEHSVLHFILLSTEQF